MFVAFDLEEYGVDGGATFVQDFLLPEVLMRYNSTRFQGAVVLDSILNFNSSAGSQVVQPSHRRYLMPGYAEAVEAGGFKGDFITVTSRGPDDSPLRNLFVKHWNHLQQGTCCSI